MGVEEICQIAGSEAMAGRVGESEDVERDSEFDR